MSIDQLTFRQVMSRFASGVTVVTTACNGTLAGLTVSSFTSLSLNPTLVLICVAESAASYSALVESKHFVVNILREDQEDVSRRFAMPDAERFVPGSFELSERGLPMLLGTLAMLECEVVNMFPGGDHTILVGEVMDARVGKGCPLLYYRSGYHQLDRP